MGKSDDYGRDVFWLGGSPCAGKSAVAERLSERYGFTYYKCDDYFDAHLKLGASRGFKVCSILSQVDHEYVFMRSHDENVQLPFDVYGEEIDLILEDVALLPRPLLVEGCALLPDKMASLDVPRDRIFYLIPCEAFYREQYAKRAWARDRLQETSDPEEAFENWMRRDVAFADRVARSAALHDFAHLWVDGSITVEETIERIAGHYGL